MKRVLAILVGVAMVCVAAYFTWLNPTTVEFRLSPARSVHAPLSALMLFAFVAGVLLILIVATIQAGRRAFLAWRLDRRQRQVARIDQWEERGERLVWEGDIHQGRSFLQRAWRHNPDRAQAVVALAASYRDTGELGRARQLLKDAADHHRTNPDVLLALAETYRSAGDHVARLEILERLRALHPRSPRVLRAMRDVYVELERWSEAAAAQQSLLSELEGTEGASSERERLTVLRYQAAISLPDPVARVEALEALADTRPQSLPILVSLGDGLLDSGRADEASMLWERTLRMTPRTVLVERLSAMATEPRHRERLRSLLRKLRADDVRSDSLRLAMAQLYLADGVLDDVGRELEAVQNPDDAPLLLQRLWGEVHRRRGQLEQAIAAYARASDSRSQYMCSGCQRVAADWVAYCPQCGGWDSYRAEAEIGLR
jgi:tetratricopeptide (TPR) repeat protein